MKKQTIEQLARIDCKIERLMRFLFIRISVVLTKTKPSVLVRYTNTSSESSQTNYDLFIENQDYICNALGLSYIELKKSDSELQILFYDQNELHKTLAAKSIRDFMTYCKYGFDNTLEANLKQLKNRFTSDSFPHEIGVFLGYPLTDVKGFVEGRTDYIHVYKGMWKVFDSVDESISKMNLYRKIEATASAVALRYNSTVKCIERLQTFAGVITRTA